MKKLCENGYETFLVTYSGNDIPERIGNIEGLDILHTKMPWYFEEVHTKIRSIQITDKAYRFLKWASYIPIRLRHFRKVLREASPDVVHAGWLDTSGFLSALSGFHPFLLMPWGSDIMVTTEKGIRWRKIVQYTLNNADMITCDCEYVKKEILEP